MERIYYAESDQGTVRLAIKDDFHEFDNIYTVVVGKNGVGKSRLLSRIAKERIRYYPFDPDYQHYRDIENLPKVIAVSTSPFDKFPSNRRSVRSLDVDSNYRYVGIRGEGPFGASSAVSLLSSAAKGWLEKIARFDNTANLIAVFKSLDFEPYAEFVFKPGYIGTPKSKDFSEDLLGDVFYQEIERLRVRHGVSLDERYLAQLADCSPEQRRDIYDAMGEISHFESQRKVVTLEVDFTTGEFHTGAHHSSRALPKAILTLLSAGLMRLMDIRLVKKNYGMMSLKRASSGEQCLLVMMLGIAGHITNNSLILIDEPEISLHPKWQEEFILMLTRIFMSYSGCQFIIATHSPQIISRLPISGCYVASLSDNSIRRSEEFSKRSADYQLAELFDAPGVMNEYIARLAFNLLSRVKAAKRVSKENWRELEQLKNLSFNVERTDPIKDLVASVVEVCEIYANN
ncbi:ATP-binding protein [Pseudomonas putida]|uniref:AAA family ATPase n=1 Tax=Pseudomonas putida TaxID=303 RepID=UPI000F78F20F|nr:AAA family ATPase [Pseudomonas putida]RSC25922.1 ATP-binding protein [Pseudomonas putida]